MAEYFEERASNAVSGNKIVANAIGSLSAGVISGYLSHVPHNLSTLKLLEPEKSYRELFNKFVTSSVNRDRIPSGLSPTMRSIAEKVYAVLFPRGCLVRTCQVRTESSIRPWACELEAMGTRVCVLCRSSSPMPVYNIHTARRLSAHL